LFWAVEVGYDGIESTRDWDQEKVDSLVEAIKGALPPGSIVREATVADEGGEGGSLHQWMKDGLKLDLAFTIPGEQPLSCPLANAYCR